MTRTWRGRAPSVERAAGVFCSRPRPGSYENTGEVVTVHKYRTGLLGRRIKKTQRFSTLFVRPDLYRFELVDVGYGTVKE